MDQDDILLMAYVDGELDAETARKVEQRIQTDAEARTKVAMFRETRDLLRSRCADSFYKNGLEHLHTPSFACRKRVRVDRRFAAVAAGLILTALVGFGGGRLSALPGSAQEAFLDEVAEYHELFARETEHLVEVAADHKTEFASWMGARLGHSFEIPDLSSAGLRFAGGRMLVVDGKPVAQMMYTRVTGLPVALCITPLSTPARKARLDERNDLRLVSWTDGRYAYVVVGELGSAAAMSIAETAERSVHS